MHYWCGFFTNHKCAVRLIGWILESWACRSPLHENTIYILFYKINGPMNQSHNLSIFHMNFIILNNFDVKKKIIELLKNSLRNEGRKLQHFKTFYRFFPQCGELYVCVNEFLFPLLNGKNTWPISGQLFIVDFMQLSYCCISTALCIGLCLPPSKQQRLFDDLYIQSFILLSNL